MSSTLNTFKTFIFPSLLFKDTINLKDKYIINLKCQYTTKKCNILTLLYNPGLCLHVLPFTCPFISNQTIDISNFISSLFVVRRVATGINKWRVYDLCWVVYIYHIVILF